MAKRDRYGRFKPKHGRMHYRNAHKRRARVRYHSVRGGHYGTFGPRYLGYRMPIGARSYKRKRRTRGRGNPFLSNPGRGTNWLLIGGIAVGAFFLMRGGGLSNLFGGGVPAGYTQLGTSGYYRGPNGQLYTRTATGQMMLSPTQATAGSTLEQQLITQGSRLAVPLVTGGISALSNWIGGLFSGGSATGAILTETGGTTVTAPDILSGAYTPPTEIAPLPDLPSLTLGEWWSAPDTSSWWTEPTPDFSLTAQPSYQMDLSLAPLEPLPMTYEDIGASFFGFASRRGGYGLARRSPSGEVEARFLRQPPSYR